MPTMVKYICGNCGKEFERQKGKHENNKSGLQFCTHACSSSWKSGKNHPQWKGAKQMHVCDECGCRFERYSTQVNGEKSFCTPQCHGKWASKNRKGQNSPSWKGKVRVSCDNCGNSLDRYPSQVAFGPHNFCNAQCRSGWLSKYNSGSNNVSFKGGYGDIYYGPNWARQKKEARSRDGHKCRHCGITEKKLSRKLDVHHITPFRDFGYDWEVNENYKEANKLSNLICLCPSCHKRAEEGQIPIQPSLL